MRIIDMISLTIRNLLRRKMRTFFTVMGVVIGTCSIVVMFSLGIGMDAALTESLSQMGDLTVITIYSYGNGGDDQPALNDEALTQIQAMPNVEAVTPFWQPSGMDIRLVSGKKDRYQMYAHNVIGVYPEALEAFGYEVKSGVPLNESTATGRKVVSVVFGEEAAYDFQDTKARRGQNAYRWKEQLPDGSFTEPFVDVESDDIRMILPPKDEEKADPLEFDVDVCGVMLGDYSKSYYTMYGIFMDINDLKSLLSQYNKENGISETENGKKKEITYSEVSVKVTDINYVESVETAIQDMGFSTSSMESIRKPMQEQIRQQQMILGSVGAMALLVAAFSIFNTMQMAIIECTREIGIMKVLGCIIGNIRTTFLMEAGCLGFFGGCFGVALSFGISAVFNYASANGGADGLGLGMMGISTGSGAAISIIPPWLVLLALAFSTGIGLASGLIPALHATKISALEAIKYE